MNSRQLTYFVEIVETGGISSAARQLNIAQPALSQHIANLEQELGTPLLIRSARGVTPTVAGEVLYQHALKILSRMRQAALDVQEEATTPRGEVSLLISPYLGEHLAPPLVSVVEKLYPKIELNVAEALSLEATRLVETARVDLGIIAQNDVSTRIRSIPLYEEPLFVVDRNPDDGHTGEVGTITFPDLTKIPLAASKKRHTIRRLLDETAERLDLNMTFKVETDAFRLYRGYVRHGVAAAVWPWATFHDMWARSEVRARRIVEPELKRTVHIGWARDYPMSAATNAVKTVVLELVTDLHQQGIVKGELKDFAAE